MTDGGGRGKSFRTMPPTHDDQLDTVPGLPARVLKSLVKEGVERVAQVVEWLPFRHEDRRQAGAAGGW